MHKTFFFPLYFFHTTRFHSVTSNSKSFSPAATLDPRPRLWTRDPRPATISQTPLLFIWKNTIGTIGLPRLARALLTLIGSCRIYYVYKIKADSFWKHYRSGNRFARKYLFEFACLFKKSVLNKMELRLVFISISYKTVFSLWNYFILMSCYTLR